MKKLIYLSGMIDGVTLEDGNGWRIKAESILSEAGFDTFNPYSGSLPDKSDTANQVFHRDIYYLDKSDIVLVNLDLPEFIENKKIPFFTIGEMFLANRDRKPVIAYTNCLVGRHGYDAIVSKSFKNLEDSTEYIITHF